MFCIYCGKQNADEAVFCQHCGRRQQTAATPQAETRVLSPRPSVAEIGGVREPAAAEQESVRQPLPSQFSSTPIGPGAAEQAISSASLELGGQTVLAWPEDGPNRIVLGGLVVVLLGFFLPWVHLRFPGFFGIAAIDTDLSGSAGGVLAWLLVIVLVALAAFVLCQEWLYRSYPQIPRWLLAMPLIAGTFVTAVSLYTIVLFLGLQAKLADVGGDAAASLISTQFGVYLVLLGGLILAVGGYQKLARELAAPLR